MGTAASDESKPLLNIKSQKWKQIYCVTVGLSVFLLVHLLLGWTLLLATLIRRGVILAARYTLKGFGRALSPADVVLVENHTEGRHAMSIVVIMTFEGDISAEEARAQFSRNVLEAKVESNKPKFPELRQFQRRFLGLPFWVEDPVFRIQNHVKEVFHGDPVTPEYFQNYESMSEEFGGRPYSPESSPWEVWLVRNYPEEDGDGARGTVLIFRAHHSLMGGLSILNILYNLLGENPVVRMPLAKALNLSQKSRYIFSTLISFPFHLLRGVCKLLTQISQNKPVTESILASRRAKKGEVVSEGKVHFKLSAKLPLAQVKEEATKWDIRVPALLTTLVAESFSQVLEESRWDSVSALFAVPLPGHPEGILNHAFTSTIQLPISSRQPIASKLRACNQTFLGLKENPVNTLIQYLTYILGSFPPGFANSVASREIHTPISITNFAVGPGGEHFEGRRCLEIKGGLGSPSLFTGSVVTMIGYRNHVQMLFAVNDSLFCEQDVARISSGIGRAFEALQRSKASSTL